MNGIVAYGAYLPRHLLARESIREVLGEGGGKGTRTVASYDEDTTSMAVEAARRARKAADFSPASLHFATTAPAYADKTNATAVHAALDLPPEVFAGDHVGSVRAAVGALRAAAADGGLAVLSDIRTGRPGSADEANGGDGAAAFAFGSGDGVIAELVAQASATAEFLERWRAPGASYSQTWEERFGLDVYLPLIREVVAQALRRAGIERPDLAVVASPHARAARAGMKPLADVLVDGVEARTGNLGAAHLGLLLCEALDRAQPGQTILAVNAADGADAFVLRVTEAIEQARKGGPALAELERATPVEYATFLTWRGMLEREPPRRPDPVPVQAPPAARATSWKFAFVGSRCRSCGRVHLPPQRVCADCGAVDAMEPAPTADRHGTITTYTVDRLAYSPSPPVISAVIDFDGGGRFSCELTDCRPDEIQAGTRVELTFRRMFTSAGIHNYFWKARPIREVALG